VALSVNEIKQIRKYFLKKYRMADSVFIAEGPKLIADALQSNYRPLRIYGTAQLSPFGGEPYTSISATELKKISQLTNPNQCVALFHFEANRQLDELLNDASPLLVLDRINDPGNLGTLIRLADWFGLKAVVCSPESADYTNSKVVQASMGSVFRIPVYYTELNSFLNDCQQHQKTILAADMHGDAVQKLENISTDFALIMGSESHGVNPNLITENVKRVTIPGFGSAESLNVGVAAGIILSHLVK